jgi:tRNA/rRNA methyltransferase
MRGKSPKLPVLGSRFSIAMVEPEHGRNLGYLARAAANFGIEELFVVGPRQLDSGNLSDARIFASHGRWLIDEIQYVESLEKLRHKFALLIGTTAIEARRKSNLIRRTIRLEACAKRLADRGEKPKQRDCFVFGRDSTGLTNEELKKCDYCVTIKTGSAYNTLNVSHAAAIVLYEFSRQHSKTSSISNRKTPERIPSSLNRASTRKERDLAIFLFEKLGEEAEFKNYKVGLLQETLKRMFARGEPSMRELYILMGLASKASAKLQRLSKSSS